MITLHEGDSRKILCQMIDRGERVHSVVCDPPYGLTSIEKRFGKDGAAPARSEKNDGSFGRISKGFLGMKWDGTGIERDPEFWRLVFEVLLPGGYVFAFSGARTGHWQACAMEMAGFIMHPMHAWVYFQGFPKAHAADKAIDKHLGKKGSVVPSGNPVKRMIPGADQVATGSWEKNNGRTYQPGIYEPATDEAVEWSGYAYGTQAQKPALEPIFLGQKPFDTKNGAANLLRHGVGAVNIDGCRVPGGRYPSNLLLDGSPEVVAMFPREAGASAPVKGTEPSSVTKDIYGKFNGRVPGTFFNDSGSAARFFHHFPLDTDPLICNPKAGKKDRAGTDHPTVKPIKLLRYLIRHITPPGGTVLDMFAGSGTTGQAAIEEGVRAVLIEMDPGYSAFIRRRFGLASRRRDYSDVLGPASRYADVLG
ncbi:Modification methylase RsrI [Hartmannibacter diazotrophicus]|uniref:site-specific DNA-methyltransferase (adenine-specific) n=1 Tax=Hartmannibacter diazotrophicus TaxID=1482074 RepID=A0A2C9D491_9HYPH|nr:site-specific DNA-methyltransferase [Hartmannibacter diazotrophicus]SON54305.1 Modification methylase RsrI [Hartmannibacter diazotrophicus]